MWTPGLTLLGTGTCRLEEDRAASSVLVDTGAARLVFDFGRGVATRVAGLGLAQDDVEHVVLSHFHPDHLSDLIPYLQAAIYSPDDPRGRDLNVYGPPGLGAVMRSIVHLVGEEDLTGQERFRLHTHELSPGMCRIGGLDCTIADLPPAGNRGLGFDLGGTRCALTGDSHFHDREIAFLESVDLAVIDSGHLSDEEIIRLAVASGAGRIVCSHFYRELDVAALTAEARVRGWNGTLEAGFDLQRLIG